jgi:hypothetical protein
VEFLSHPCTISWNPPSCLVFLVCSPESLEPPPF